MQKNPCRLNTMTCINQEANLLTLLPSPSMLLKMDWMMLDDNWWSRFREMGSLWLAPSWTIVCEFEMSFFPSNPTPSFSVNWRNPSFPSNANPVSSNLNRCPTSLLLTLLLLLFLLLFLFTSTIPGPLRIVFTAERNIRRHQSIASFARYDLRWAHRHKLVEGLVDRVVPFRKGFLLSWTPVALRVDSYETYAYSHQQSEDRSGVHDRGNLNLLSKQWRDDNFDPNLKNEEKGMVLEWSSPLHHPPDCY